MADSTFFQQLVYLTSKAIDSSTTDIVGNVIARLKESAMKDAERGNSDTYLILNEEEFNVRGLIEIECEFYFDRFELFTHPNCRTGTLWVSWYVE